MTIDDKDMARRIARLEEIEELEARNRLVAAGTYAERTKAARERRTLEMDWFRAAISQARAAAEVQRELPYILCAQNTALNRIAAALEGKRKAKK